MPEGKLLKKASFEERIKRILLMPELEMDGNAYMGKYELNNRKSITQFILDELRKAYTNLATGDNIQVSGKSADKLATHCGEAYQKSIAHIPEIIEKMQYLDKKPADKTDAHFKEYSYYITPAKIDRETYTILSTVGYSGKEIYYDQNMFIGTPEKVFEEARNSTANKYSRLSEILRSVEKGNQSSAEIIPSEPLAASNSKYNKFSEEKQG
jgi:hypothetical protein